MGWWQAAKDFWWGNYEQSKVYDNISFQGYTAEAFGDKIEDEIIKFIVNQIMHVTDLLVNLMMEIPLEFLNSPGFRDLYSTIVQLTLAIITPIVMYFGLKMMLGKITETQMWESIKRFLFLPLFIVMMPVVIRKMIIIVNRISNQLLDLNRARHLFYPDQLSPVLILAAILLLFYLGKVLLWYAVRNIKMIFMIIVAPLLSVLWCFPGKYSGFDKWMNEMATLLFTQVAHIIQLLILLKISAGQSGSAMKQIVMQIGLLILMTQTEGWLAKQFNGDDVKMPNISKYKNQAQTGWKYIKKLKFW